LNLLLIPFGATVQAWLHRHMRFVPLLVIRLGSTLTQVSTGITLAWLGHGFMSLAWSSVAGVLATVVLANCFRPPQLRVMPGLRNLGRVFSFGGKSISMGLLTELGNGLPEMVIGRTLGLAPVGIYARAQGQVQLFWRLFGESILSVGLPHFARLHREGKPLQTHYAHGAQCVVGVVWPLFAFLGLFAEPIVRVLYGPQWLASAALVPLMCFNSALGMWLPLSHEVLMGTGRINQALWQIALWVVLFAAALVVCSPYGLAAVVQAGVGITVIGLLWRYYLLRGWALAPGVLMGVAWRGLAVTAVAMVGPVLVRLVLGAAPPQPLAALVLAGALAVPGWVLGLALIGHPLAHEVVRLIGRVAPRLPVGWMLRRVATDA
jgi:O-antigen/teichoic acid export membrane protein